MKRRSRKLIATAIMVLFVLVYPLIVIQFAYALLPGASKLGQLAFYLVGGLAWVLPIMPLIRWMERLDPPPTPPSTPR